MARLLLLATFAAAALADRTAAEGTARPPCKVPKGAVVVAQERGGVVYRRRESGAIAHYGCLRAKGRRVLLSFEDSGRSAVRRVVLAGSWVALVIEDLSSQPGGATDPPGSAPEPISDEVRVRDLRARCNRRSAPATRCRSRGARRVRDLVLTSTGAAAWVQGDSVPAVSKDDGDGTEDVLDQGPVEPGSLALSASGRRLYWVTDGAAKTAEIGL